MQLKLFIFAYLIISFSFSNAEDLKTVLKDAYNFFPDIQKSQSELKNAKKIYRFQKQISFHQLSSRLHKEEI